MNPSEDIWSEEEILRQLPFGSAWRPMILETTHSTNDVAKSAAQKGAAPGLVVLANEQTAGRGRAGRTWHSPAGEGLYVSILIKPEFEARFAGRLGIVTAVSVADAIENACSIRPKIKWPNDLLLTGKKVGGILIETELAGTEIEYAIIGIGINIRSRNMPDDLADRATSIYLATGKACRRADLLVHLLQAIEGRLSQDFETVRKTWEQGCDLVSCQVEMKTREGVLSGTVLGLNEDGSLILETPEGRRTALCVGDMNVTRRGD